MSWRRRLGAGAAAVGAGAVLLVGVGFDPTAWPLLVRWFGPPAVAMHERYADDVGRAQLRHDALSELLAVHVRGGGVDYAGLAANGDALRAYTASLAEAPFAALSRDGKLALLINAYNAFTLQLMLEHPEVASIRDIPAPGPWDDERWAVAGRVVSLSQLEHALLRRDFIEPRIHFAINCASRSCPALRAEAYEGATLEAQLEDQAAAVHRDPGFAQLTPEVARLSRIYLWYGEDFAAVAGDVRGYARRYLPGLRDQRIEWLDYDWSLNTAPSAPGD